MQFSNHYLVTTIKNAQIIQGNCPPNLSLTISTTNTKAEDVFCAINTLETFDELYKKGIAGLIISHSNVTALLPHIKKIAGQNFFLMSVPNVIDSLYQLTKQIRINTKEKIVLAVAGTNGTGVTKKLLSRIIEQNEKPILVAPENATLLELALFIINNVTNNKIFLFEAISNKRHNMKTISETIRPTYAIINSVGHYNVDTIGSIQDVAIEQREIFSSFTENNIGVINGDQSELSSISYPHPIVKFGKKITNQIQARKIQVTNSETHCILKIYKEKYPVVIKTTSNETLYAILSTIAIAKLLQIPDSVIISSIQEPLKVSSCFENKKIKSGNGSIIDDTRNTNPESMKSSLLAFHHLEHSGPKIIVLGDMNGLGISSAFWHRQIGRFLRKVQSVERLFIIGKHSIHLAKTAPKEFDPIIVNKWQDLIPYLEEYFSTKPAILIKGGEESGLKNLIETLCNE